MGQLLAVVLGAELGGVLSYLGDGGFFLEAFDDGLSFPEFYGGGEGGRSVG